MRACLKTLIFCLSLPLFIQGCGFKWQNSKTPLSLCITGNNADTIKKSLSHVCTKNSPILTVIDVSTNQKDIASSMNNSYRQYQRERFILFNIKTSKHLPYRNNVRLSVNKPFIMNNNSILSSNAESELLSAEMEKELLTRLKFYLVTQLK